MRAVKAGIATIIVAAAIPLLMYTPAPSQTTGSTMHKMADGKEWTTANLNVNASPSYCYDDAERNCRRYGRLYTWESAQRVCQSLAGSSQAANVSAKSSSGWLCAYQ